MWTLCGSTTATSVMPRLPRRAAALIPALPPPTIRTSKVRSLGVGAALHVRAVPRLGGGESSWAGMEVVGPTPPPPATDFVAGGGDALDHSARLATGSDAHAACARACAAGSRAGTRSWHARGRSAGSGTRATARHLGRRATGSGACTGSTWARSPWPRRVRRLRRVHRCPVRPCPPTARPAPSWSCWAPSWSVVLVVVLVVLEVEDSDPLSLEPQAVSALMAMTAAIPAVTGRRRVIR